MFFGSKKVTAMRSDPSGDFSYLPSDVCYLDAACQTLRPQVVLDAEHEYFTTYNACGGRVKYRWGQKVDGKVQQTRESLLAYAGKSSSDYAVAFTLNTTYGINLVLHQLPETYRHIITSDIEHNSVFLPVQTWAQKRGAERLVLQREDNGSIVLPASMPKGAAVVMNSMSNIDGRTLGNLPQLAESIHASSGILLIDGAQGFGHDIETIRKTDFDAAFGSGHKMYGPSIGFVIVRRSLLRSLQPFFIGGGTVSDVTPDRYDLQKAPEEEHAILEAGLQNWGGIIGLGAAVSWIGTQDAARKREIKLSETLFEALSTMQRVHLINRTPSSVVSFHVDGIDAHRLALYFSQKNVMCRSGHFCCHSYLAHTMKLPPLLRISLGLYTTESDVELFLHTLRHILSTL